MFPPMKSATVSILVLKLFLLFLFLGRGGEGTQEAQVYQLYT